MRYFNGLLLLLLSLPLSAQEAPLFEITGSVSLRWEAPTTNVDGTPLTDLARYKIYWGTSSRNYSMTLDVDDPDSTNRSFAFPLDSEGQTEWHFSMTAIDEDGNESEYSNEVVKVIEVTVIDNRPPAPPTLIDTTLTLECEGSSVDVTCTVTVSDG